VAASFLNLELGLHLNHRRLLILVFLSFDFPLLLLRSRLLLRSFPHNVLLLLLLLFLLLLLLLLLLLRFLRLLSLRLLSLLTLLFLLLHTLLLLLLPFAFSLLLLFLLGLLCLLLLSQGFLLSSSLISLSLCLVLVFVALLASNAENLHHMRSGVNASSGGPEHLLQEEVGLFRFVASHNLGGLAVDLLSNDKLCQLQQLNKPVDFGVLLSDRLPIEFGFVKESVTVASLLKRGCEDVVYVSEGRLSE
jgi:hypothetical protein